jgi:hypothetical protein
VQQAGRTRYGPAADIQQIVVHLTTHSTSC